MKTLLTLALALTLVGGMAHAQQNLCYSWEDGGTVLGGTLLDFLHIENTDVRAYPIPGQSRSLEIVKKQDAGNGTPQAWIAWITGLQTGDSVSASIETWDDSLGASPSVRIWGHWTNPGGPIDDVAYQAGGSPTYSGPAGMDPVDWFELSHTWNVLEDQNGFGLVVQIRAYPSTGVPPPGLSNWVDYLCIIAPNHATIHFPEAGFNQPPVVSNVYHRPLLPQSTHTVTVHANAVDNDGSIASVMLHYRVNEGALTPVAMGQQPDGSYTGQIPPQANGSVVEYYVEAEDNQGAFGRNPSSGFYSYTVAPETIIPIGSIHDFYETYEGQYVKVQGQVYVPGDHRGTGDIAAYIQGSDGRGLSIFGDIRSTGMQHLNNVGHIVKVTGRVSKYFTTVQLQNYEVELVSMGNPQLVPVTLTTGNAALPANEGSYIKSLGVIQDKATTGSGLNLAYNFTVNDGSGPVVVRVYENTVPGVMQDWNVGEMLEAAGAGGTYQDDGQIIVGLASDLNKYADTIPPTLVSAVLFLPEKVRVQFSEPVSMATGQNTDNYYVHQTANYYAFVEVTDAEVQVANPSIVILTLAESIEGVEHTLEVYNVRDLANNLISPNPSSRPIEEQLMQILCYGWENNETVLSSWAPDVLYVANSSTYAFEGTRSLEIYKNAEGTTPQAYVAWIKNLQVGDQVTASFQVMDLVPGNPRVRIWGHWTPPGIDVNAYAGSADGNPTYSSGSGAWEELGHTWTVPSDKNNHGLIVEIRPYNDDPWSGSNWVDNLCVIAPAHATIVFPGGLASVDVPVLATALKPNYPNPFNPATTFSFSLENDARVELTVFDLRGRKVRTVVEAQLSQGTYTNVYTWDGRDDQGRMMNSGTYFYRLTTDDGHVEARKMTLLK